MWKLRTISTWNFPQIFPRTEIYLLIISVSGNTRFTVQTGKNNARPMQDCTSIELGNKGKAIHSHREFTINSKMMDNNSSSLDDEEERRR